MNSNQNLDTKTKSNTVRNVVLVVVAVTVVLAALFGGSYNSMNSKRNDVDASWSQVENVMQRRMDLIPNLVNAVKGSMKHEEKVFGAISDARSAYDFASTNNDKLKADSDMTSHLSTLMTAVSENYPTLASNDNVQTLMTQLEGSENRISVERKRYIDAVNDYNIKVTGFPTVMIAGPLGFHKMDNFKADKGADKAPKVDLE